MIQKPVLIVDKKGELGEALAQALGKKNQECVLVTGRNVVQETNTKIVPFKRKTPLIPDLKYQAMLLFFEGDKTLFTLLSSFYQKAEHEGAKLFFIANARQINAKAHKMLQSRFPNISLVLYGDLLEQGQNPLTRLWQGATKQGKITLWSSGLNHVFPLLEKELIEGIEQVLAESEKTTFFIAHPLHTELSLVRYFKTRIPSLKIDLKEKKKEEFVYVPEQKKDILPKGRLEELLSKKEPAGYDLEKKETKKRFGQKEILMKAAGFLGVFFLAQTFCFLLIAVFSFLFFLGSAINMTHGNFKEAKTEAILSDFSFGAAKSILDLFSLETGGALTNSSFWQKTRGAISFGKNVSLSLSDLARMGEEAAGKLRENKALTRDDFLNLLAEAKQLRLFLEEAKGAKILPVFLQAKIKKADSFSSFFAGLEPVLAEVLGFEGEKTFLVLFQNNMELRPGGGFIGSYGLLRVNKGQIVDFKIHDVYDADGRLTGHIEPPFPLKRFVGINHWFLRDSNFSPEFPQNANSALRFLSLETADRADGVIAIDTSFLRSLLGALGPVYVPEYKEKVTSANFFQLTQSHAERNFFPGSTQKKDFLRALFTSLMLSLKEKKTLPLSSILKDIKENLAEKHILLYANDPSLQRVFSLSSFSSAWQQEKIGKNTIADFLGLNEANIGLNKANYYLKRSITQEVSFNPTQGAFEETVKIRYVNFSNNSLPFSGPYRNYLRLILPLNASLTGIALDGKEQKIIPAVTDPRIYASKSFVVPSGLEVAREELDGKQMIGFLLTIPPSKTLDVTVSYSLPISFVAQTFSYQLNLFKQAGTGSDPYTLIINYPDSFSVLGTRNLNKNTKSLMYAGEIKKDMLFSAGFVAP